MLTLESVLDKKKQQTEFKQNVMGRYSDKKLQDESKARFMYFVIFLKYGFNLNLYFFI